MLPSFSQTEGKNLVSKHPSHSATQSPTNRIQPPQLFSRELLRHQPGCCLFKQPKRLFVNDQRCLSDVLKLGPSAYMGLKIAAGQNLNTSTQEITPIEPDESVQKFIPRQ